MTHRTVRDQMTRDVATVGVSTPYKAVVELLESRRISAVPVLDPDGRVIGVVSEADLLAKVEFEGVDEPAPFLDRNRKARAKAVGTTAGDVMTSPAVTITPEESVTAAARLMDRKRVKRLPVVDTDGRLVGIVSRHDLLRVFVQTDESIRAEVLDGVFRRILWIEPPQVAVDVEGGVVTLAGELDQRSVVDIAVRLTTAVDGVVGVVNKLGYRVDDRRLEAPDPLLGRTTEQWR
jgi:CBS domain-containing protein